MLRRLYDWNGARQAPPLVAAAGAGGLHREFYLSHSVRCHAHPDGAGGAAAGLADRRGLHRRLGGGRARGLRHRPFLWQALGQPLSEFYGYGHEYERFGAAYNERAIRPSLCMASMVTRVHHVLEPAIGLEPADAPAELLRQGVAVQRRRAGDQRAQQRQSRS